MVFFNEQINKAGEKSECFTWNIDPNLLSQCFT